MIAALVRWLDSDIERNLGNQAVGLIAGLGVVPGALTGWNWFTVAVGIAWGTAWIGLWLWRMTAWMKREAAKKRRRVRREALRVARAASAKPQTND